MRFKENAFKPGMIIHCPTEEDARALLEYLGKHRYWWQGGKALDDKLMFNHIKDNYKNNYDFYFKLGVRKDDLSGTVIMTFYEGEGAITEFSDLIEPDDSPINSPTDSPMSAVEVLEWLKNNGGEKNNTPLYEMFGFHYAGSIVEVYDAQEIINKITAYEAAKKAPKPVEVESGYRCYVFMGEHTAYTSETEEYELWGVTEDEAKDDVKAKAIEKTKETGKFASAEYYFICRVKEGES